MASKVTRTCISIVYSVKVYNENNDSVSSKEVMIPEDSKPEKAINAELSDNETAIKFKPIKKVEELRVMSAECYVKHSTVEKRTELPLE